jgi:hypothetical protein
MATARLRALLAAGVAVATLSGGAAFAQESVPVPVDPGPTKPASPGREVAPGYNPGPANDGYRDRSGHRGGYDADAASKISVAAGAGLSDFTGSLGSRTNAGPGWNVRAGYDLGRNVGFEVGYLGARNGIDDTSLPAAHSITTTGLNGDLKLTAPIEAGRVTLKPYVFGGLGAAYFGVSGDVPGYQSNSNVQVPLGVGGDAFLSQNVSVGARLGYFVNVANRIADQGAGNLYNATANLGVHY